MATDPDSNGRAARAEKSEALDRHEPALYCLETQIVTVNESHAEQRRALHGENFDLSLLTIPEQGHLIHIDHDLTSACQEGGLAAKNGRTRAAHAAGGRVVTPVKPVSTTNSTSPSPPRPRTLRET
jgi:hypothetical protein